MTQNKVANAPLNDRREVLMESGAPKAQTAVASVSAILLGALFLWGALDSFREGAFWRSGVSMLLIGVISIYASSYRRRLYFSPEGIVRETASWFSRSRTVLAWGEIRHVTLALRKDEMLGLFEKGTMGWKVPLKRDQEPGLREILRKYAPLVEVDVI